MKIEPKFRKGQAIPCGMTVTFQNEEDVHLLAIALRFLRNASPEEDKATFKRFTKMQMSLAGAVEAIDGEADIFLQGDEITKDYHETRKKFDPGYEVPA